MDFDTLYAEYFDRIYAYLCCRVGAEAEDIAALYCAWRVTEVKDVTYAQLENNVKKWIMTAETKKLFLDKLQDILNNGKSRPLTAEERKKHDANLDRIRTLLAPGRKDTALIGRHAQNTDRANG